MKIYWRYYLRIILWFIEDSIVMKEHWNDRKKTHALLNYEKKLGVVEMVDNIPLFWWKLSKRHALLGRETRSCWRLTRWQECCDYLGNDVKNGFPDGFTRKQRPLMAGDLCSQSQSSICVTYWHWYTLVKTSLLSTKTYYSTKHWGLDWR